MQPEAGFSVTGNGFLQMRECATAGALAVCMLTSAYHSESYLRPCIQKSFRASATLLLQMWKTQLLLLQFTHEKHCYCMFLFSLLSYVAAIRSFTWIFFSVADLRSGAFLTPGSGMGKKSIFDISESLETIFWVKKTPKILWCGSGICLVRDGKHSDPWSGINIPDSQHWFVSSFSFVFFLLLPLTVQYISFYFEVCCDIDFELRWRPPSLAHPFPLSNFIQPRSRG